MDKDQPLSAPARFTLSINELPFWSVQIIKHSPQHGSAAILNCWLKIFTICYRSGHFPPCHTPVGTPFSLHCLEAFKAK